MGTTKGERFTLDDLAAAHPADRFDLAQRAELAREAGEIEAIAMTAEVPVLRRRIRLMAERATRLAAAGASRE